MIEAQVEPLVPPRWARNGHSQTLLGHFLRTPPLQNSGQRVEFKLPDGDVLVGRYHAGTSPNVVYLFHGLTADINAGYVLRAAELALSRGDSVYRINHRGCGEGWGLARQPYHSGRGEDIAAVLEQSHVAGKRQIAIGFSLSANALLTLMTGLRGSYQPDAAIAVNPPIDLRQATHALGRGFNRIYDLNFVLALRSTLKIMNREGLLDREFKIPPHITLNDFDQIFTAPMGGFRDNEDYYAQCSTWQHLDKVTRPTVIITAQDDPFIKYDAFERAKLSEHVTLHAEPQGGHLGYIHHQKTPLGTHRWLDYAISKYLAAFDQL